MAKGGKPPATPSYQQPAPYQQPNPAASPLNTYVPPVSTPTQLINQANRIEGMPALAKGQKGGQLPSWMSLANDPTNLEAQKKAADYYMQMYGNPALAQTQAGLYTNGQSYGSYGGAQLGQEQAMYGLNSYEAGLAKTQQDLNNQLAARNAYFGQDVALGQGQNANDISRSMGIAQLDYGNTANQNQYNMNTANAQNQYGLQNYQNQLGLYGINQQAQANKAQLGLLGGFGLGKLAYGGASKMFGNRNTGTGGMGGSSGGTNLYDFGAQSGGLY